MNSHESSEISIVFTFSIGVYTLEHINSLINYNITKFINESINRRIIDERYKIDASKCKFLLDFNPHVEKCLIVITGCLRVYLSITNGIGPLFDFSSTNKNPYSCYHSGRYYSTHKVKVMPTEW